ncbi:MAG: tripartite tricarboxylate transporter substrate-binding protein [Pseudomonadota bacterium]
MNRRNVLKAGASSVLAVWLGQAKAQGADPLRLVIPFPPGGGTDVLGRAIAQRLEAVLKRPVIVDNRPGAGGIIGTEHVAQSAKDGRTLLFAGVVPMPKLYTVPESINGIAPVTTIARSPYLLVVHPSVRANTLAELIVLAKAKPGELNFGTPGNATPQHLTIEMLNVAAGIQLVSVPYKGAGPMIADLVGGQTQATIATVSSVEAFVRNGRLRALAVTGASRWDKMPSIPTVAESGFPDFRADIGFATFVAAGTPRNIVMALNAALHETLAQKEVRDKLAEQGYTPAGGTPEELGAALRREIENVRALVTSGRVKIEL